jgi:dolichol-phosphate mannosyltransferase
VRKEEKGLSTAVMKGFELARGEICIVMDADLSHPVEKIPNMIKPILEGKCDATVGSRYIKGGDCEQWPLFRKIVSKGAGYLAKGVTNLSDPTSGFMAIRKSLLDGVKLNPLGWKIVLEVIVKTNSHFMEIPIVFADRQKGKSKLNFQVQMDYLRHLWQLYCYKFPIIDQFIKFCTVGFLGLIVDTAVLVSIVELLLFDPRLAAIFAFLAAVIWNYTFNRVWTFEKGRYTKIVHSYISFVAVCLVGLGIRIGVMHLLIQYGGMGRKPWYILASFVGIFLATIFNFLGSKYIAFSSFFFRSK